MKKGDFPAQFASKCPALLKKFQKVRLMVAGDMVVDEALYGDSERISREAPVLILRYTHTDFTPGGAANAANNATDLGAQVFHWEWWGKMNKGRNYFFISR